MTTTATPKPGTPAEVEGIAVTIDGVEVTVPKGTLIIRAAEQIGIQIPRFCDHPLLKPAGACRQCLVMVATPDREGNVREMPKPQASCTMEVSPGMVVSTQRTSEVADKAQHGVMELLLINHPLDCPVCDKGGECPLQNQAMSNGRTNSRFTDVKRTYPKPVKISTEILLDRDRCILCQRCTRFQAEIPGDPFIDLQGRGGGAPGGADHGMLPQQIGAYDEGVLGFAGIDGEVREAAETGQMVGPNGDPALLSGIAYTVGTAELDATGRPFASYFSGNTIQICPVGALTSATYRFRSRPFDLVSTESIAEHDASGSAIRIDHRRGVVLRRLAGDDPAVNEEWITDKDRFAFTWQALPDVIQTPLVRDEETGELVAASWSEAIALAARGLAQAADDGGVGVLPGGRLTLEDAYAWSKFARVVLGTNDVDFRARANSPEEAEFLGHAVAGVSMDVTFAGLESAPHVLLVGLEPEDEAGTIFLRLRKAVLAGRTSVSTLAPFATRGSTKVRAALVTTEPGAEATTLAAIAAGTGDHAELAESLRAEGAVILVGERLAQVPGGLTAVLELAKATGARLAWVPRRAGDRGAVEVGLLPGLLPGGRPVTDAEARVDVASAWGLDADAALPGEIGRDHAAILADAGSGELAGLLLGGIDIEDLPGAGESERAVREAGFVVQLEVRTSALSRYADVVLPVAPPTMKAGTFLNWEGRPRPFGQVFATSARSDAQVLDMLAEGMGVDLGTGSLEAVHRELSELAAWDGARQPAPAVEPSPAPVPSAGEHTVATWRLMLDAARGQDGEPYLAGTAHRPVVRVSPGTASSQGVADGDRLTVVGPLGSVTLPVLVTPMPDHVVWLPLHSPGSSLYRMLGVGSGGSVRLASAERATNGEVIR
ncbi:NADH-quinone oxidoreductase subunit G [Pseudactinotalea suaedae]|uniref:NADH-quinone oxidoreductase subunit G n=1 Tax=Pseudactinotalea suaedae TaxID=1524924 RepID=UPI0012E134E0|nr:NADH-quinone oxidoreductase subunit G [Pseudactinotalea suaedae]